jgi:hypothetical protein
MGVSTWKSHIDHHYINSGFDSFGATDPVGFMAHAARFIDLSTRSILHTHKHFKWPEEACLRQRSTTALRFQLFRKYQP